MFPVPLVLRVGRGRAIKIKTVNIKEYKSFIPSIYIFSSFLFIFTFGQGGGVTGKVEIRDYCLRSL